MVYNGHTYKSEEEGHFAEWLDEGVAHGLFITWRYECESYELIARQDDDHGKMVYRPLSYTPDYEVVLTSKGELAFPEWGKHAVVHTVILDVKGGYDPWRKDDRHLTAMRKLMYKVYGIFVHKVTIEKNFWKETWLPDSMALSPKQKKPTSISKVCVTVDKFCERIQGKQGELL
jgi:hypothetical protein